MRTTSQFSLQNPADFKEKLIRWASGSSVFCWMDSNGHKDPLGRFDGLLGLGAATVLEANARGAFDALSAFRSDCSDWLMGYLGYDLKNDLEELRSGNPDRLAFPDLYFFQPEKLIEIRDGMAVFRYLPGPAGSPESDYEEIMDARPPENPEPGGPYAIRMGIFKEAYFMAASELHQAIRRGDIYEANFCQEFYVENASLDTAGVYARLNEISRPPFGAWMRFGHRNILCASPERYLCRRGSRVWSQPMKGTARRDPDPEVDQSLARELLASPKERAENIMIADLVRNDLSRSAMRGTVRADGLCELKSFAQVHQLISTIEAVMPADTDPVQPIRDTFPMGSMTGAPKISAMHTIERLESFRRGAYSGALGYFDPEGDFDFNVIIRSLLYDARKELVTFPVGGAFTSGADPASEYEECLLKAQAMRQVLENDGFV